MNIIREEKYYYRIFNIPSSLDIDALLDFLRKKDISETTLQILDPTYIISMKQLLSAIYHTEKSFKEERNIARNKGNELLIRLAGKRQISNALKTYGLKKSSKYLLILAFGETFDKSEREIDFVVKQFELSKEELESRLPISSLEILAEFYDCKEDLDEIEKQALEKIASVEIL
jgi:tRNA threonylcarbamoyladenosine modification (KEOPS) complex Cgi121 subunit